MTDPAPIAPFGTTTLDRLRDRFPNPPEVEHVETPEEAAERHANALAYRQRVWNVPPQFADASLADVPDDRVRAWPDSGVRNLILWSKITGNGKSTAAHAIGNHVVRTGGIAVTWLVSRLNAALRPGGPPNVYEAVCEADLLVLDDLGREAVTDWTTDRLLDILEARGTKRTVVTTNLDGAALVARYGDSVADRLVDQAWIVPFTGPSYRKPAPW